MNRVFSGVQPSGHLHIGNYLGAIKTWVDLQNKQETLFCIVDLNGIGTINPQDLCSYVRKTAATYLACGIDPKKSIIFKQSDISAHAELAWILGCITPLGWLNRMTQFKQKSASAKAGANLALYSYPVLMAADILLYKANLVPVGEDQAQHLELTKQIAKSFNEKFKQNYFKPPEAIIFKERARIMSLRDSSQKMSKSDPSDYSRINFTDSTDKIYKKIKKATTDSCGELTKNLQNRPEIKNLINIYTAMKNINLGQACAELKNENCSSFKEKLAELLISEISPIRNKIMELMEDTTHIDKIIAVGCERATSIADCNLREIKKIVTS